jgi:hypothetical protein
VVGEKREEKRERRRTRRRRLQKMKDGKSGKRERIMLWGKQRGEERWKEEEKEK